MYKHTVDKLREIRIHKILGVKDDGRRLMLKCPFHSDGTPSFALYPENNYYCFGCNKSGNGSIDFCRDLGFDFIESCQELEKYL